jgi:hypothetical protein
LAHTQHIANMTNILAANLFITEESSADTNSACSIAGVPPHILANAAVAADVRAYAVYRRRLRKID